MNVLLITTLITFASLAAGPASADTLGRLGELTITEEDLQAALLSLSPGQTEAVRTDSTLLEQVVRSYLVQRLVLKRATDEGWDKAPQVVAKVERSRVSVITESYLEKVAQPPDGYPSDEDVRAAYAKDREALRIPRSFRLGQIFIPEADPGKLEEVKKRLRAGEVDFDLLAEQFSADAVSASRGGEIGWLTEAQIDKEFLPVVLALKLNSVSEPVRLKDGWHFLKLLDGRASHLPTLEQVRPQLIQRLRASIIQANTQAYLAALLKQHPLSINPEALAKVLSSPPSAPSEP
jgi:hypothetical protein